MVHMIQKTSPAFFLRVYLQQHNPVFAMLPALKEVAGMHLYSCKDLRALLTKVLYH